MQIIRMAGAYLAAVATTFVLSSAFQTQQGIAKLGAEYTLDQQLATYLSNIQGQAAGLGAVLAIALLVGFLVAAVVKRVLKPLAPFAYPIAGAAAVYTTIWTVETFVAEGAGAFYGASGSIGIALQCLAGFAGGLVFAMLRGASR